MQPAASQISGLGLQKGFRVSEGDALDACLFFTGCGADACLFFTGCVPRRFFRLFILYGYVPRRVQDVKILFF